MRGGLLVNSHLQGKGLRGGHQRSDVDVHVYLLCGRINGVVTGKVHERWLGLKSVEDVLGDLTRVSVPTAVDLCVWYGVHAVQGALRTCFCGVVGITRAWPAHLVLDVVVVTCGLSVHQRFERSIGGGTRRAGRRTEYLDERTTNGNVAHHHHLLGHGVVLRCRIRLSVGVGRPKL